MKFDISGCASLLCFRDHLPEYNMRLVKADDSESNTLNTLRDMIAIFHDSMIMTSANFGIRKSWLERVRHCCALCPV